MAGKGLYANIHAKRKRGGKMRKKGAKGAPTAAKSKSGKRMQASVGGGAGQTSREKILFQLNKNIKNVKEKMGGRKITRSQEDKLRDIIKKRKKP